MPKLTINGKEVEVPAGTNLIEAARRLGIEIPHYCYHPGLSIAGQCRLCMVDIDKVPRPQIACNTQVAEGMVVARFYAHESCGQCTPCRESTGWIYKMAHRIVEGKGRKEDLDTILDVAKRGAGTTICAFYDGAIGPYISYIEKFRSEFEALCRS